MAAKAVVVAAVTDSTIYCIVKRIFLTTAALCSLALSFAQTPTDSSRYSKRKLSIEEINLVSSYYRQNGNNSAVTGGIGTEKLTDISNNLDVRLFLFDKKNRKNIFDLEVGFDHYTSASSDKIDLKANSSASSADTRIYPSLSWSRENDAKGTTIGAGLSFSSEFDYQSRGINLMFAKKSADKNGEFTAKLQGYFDQVTLVKPIELRSGGEHERYGNANRNTYALSLSYTQVVNTRLQVALLTDLVQQNGYLGLPFHRVYLTDGSVHQEKLPDQRFKMPIGIRANYFAGDRVVFRSYYRFYTDNWGVRSHTAELETPVKINPFFSLSPFYRFTHQQATRYFAGYEQHTAADEFYTSNYDLSAFNSHFAGMGLRLSPEKGVFGIAKLQSLELRYGHYSRSTGLNANIISLHLRYK